MDALQKLISRYITRPDRSDRKRIEMENKHQSQIDKGVGLFYIVLEHSNHRLENRLGDAFIFDDMEAAKERADKASTSGIGRHVPMSVYEYNLKFGKHMHSEAVKEP